ncbi:MAG: hypothetical protein ABI867_43630 [Kofleriaceae bacterium]
MKWILAGVLAVACRHPIETIPYTADMLASIDVFDGLQSSGGEIRIAWPSGHKAPAAGTRFVAIDRTGFVAILESGALEDGQLHTRALTELRPCHRCTVVGPTRAALPHGRVLHHLRPLTWFIHPGDPEWTVNRTIDLDGDGRVDLEQRRRCAATTHSGCSDRICERVCFAIHGHPEHCEHTASEIDNCDDEP